MKSQTTKDLEQCALNTFKKMGTFLCFEVGINIEQEAFPIWYERALKYSKQLNIAPPEKTNREITEIVDKVENKLRSVGGTEVSSQLIGEYVMKILADVDEVAYIRYASVYREFKDMHAFADELRELMDREENNSKD